MLHPSVGSLSSLRRVSCSSSTSCVIVDLAQAENGSNCHLPDLRDSTWARETADGHTCVFRHLGSTLPKISRISCNPRNSSRCFWMA